MPKFHIDTGFDSCRERDGDFGCSRGDGRIRFDAATQKEQPVPRHSGPKKTKFTLWLPDEMIADLTRIQRYMGKESLAEVIRDAAVVYRDLLKARENGVELFFDDAASGRKGPIWILPGPPPSQRRGK